MFTYHVRCRHADIEKNIDLIIRQNSFAPFLLTIESKCPMPHKNDRQGTFFGVLFYLTEKKWVLGISEKSIDFSALCKKLLQTSKPKEKLINIFEIEGIAYLESSKPYRLSPIEIKKPWGKEVWYTGIERRGVSSLKTPSGYLPLHYVNAVLPKRLKGSAFDSDVILLKILKTKSNARGDLYIELHKKKEEVYVVDSIDQKVYKNKEAPLLYGMDEEKIKKMGLESYKKLLLDEITSYEKHREKVDAQFHELCQKEGIDLNACLDEKQDKLLYGQIPKEIIQKDLKDYQKIRSFFGKSLLREGSVVRIEKGVPHSIPHGVRVVEFQNAYYERKIIAFNQKVLTQKRWDTKEALDVMKKSSPLNEPNIFYEGDNYLERELAKFEDYTVDEIVIHPGYRHVNYAADFYQILYCLGNSLEVETEMDSMMLQKSEAIFIPIETTITIYNSQTSDVSFLIAYPNI